MLSGVGANATTQSKHPGAAGCAHAGAGNSTESHMLTPLPEKGIAAFLSFVVKSPCHAEKEEKEDLQRHHGGQNHVARGDWHSPVGEAGGKSQASQEGKAQTVYRPPDI